MDLAHYITIDPSIRFGKPVLNGTRITVSEVLQMLATMSRDDMREDFPQITEEHIKAALLFAAHQEDRVVIKVA